ncbi:helix-turn-helix domain-containing protein [Aquimarina sp. 2-A2]|uniref:helix-turn-helix domain-containing protein n=1 Tax=Aquimarina sp. 2-A2 TaxID=3382644 RepID=UPI00387F05E3
MISLKKGQYYGENYRKLNYDTYIITETTYTHSYVDWHYHENPYFTFLLEGKLFEANKKKSYNLVAGNLLFHNWDDAHYNQKSKDFTKGFHIELSQAWLKDHEIDLMPLQGSLHIHNPEIIQKMCAILIESRINDTLSKTSIDLLLIDILELKSSEKKAITSSPVWIDKLTEILLDATTMDHTVNSLSTELGIHPVYLSRAFHKHFGMSFGHYTRLLKLNRAIILMLTSKHSMTEIAYLSGFYDQSHFIGCFKKYYHTTPLQFLKKIESGY